MEQTTTSPQQSTDIPVPQPFTKKQRKELKRQEKTKEQEKLKRKQRAKRFIKWGVMLLLLVGVIWLISVAVNSTPNTTGRLGEKISPHDWTQGTAGALVELVEYSDFQCPACERFYPFVKKLLEEKGTDIYFAYRHFPLTSIHKNAERAARAAEAAGSQGKFFEMHDLLFENQTLWSPMSSDKARAQFITFAEQLGLQKEQFAVDLNNKELKDKIDAHYRSGLATGVQGTPTFYVNGTAIQNPSTYEEFEKLVFEAAPSAPGE